MERYEIKSQFYKKKFLGIQWNKQKQYYIYDNVENKRLSTFYIYDELPNAIKECNYINNYEKANNYRVFVDGNKRYFVCFKAFSIYGVSTEIFIDEKGVFYLKVNAGNKMVSKQAPFVRGSTLVSINGEYTLDAACELLDSIRKVDKEEEKTIKEKELFDANAKKGTPVSCM